MPAELRTQHYQNAAVAAIASVTAVCHLQVCNLLDVAKCLIYAAVTMTVVSSTSHYFSAAVNAHTGCCCRPVRLLHGLPCSMACTLLCLLTQDPKQLLLMHGLHAAAAAALTGPQRSLQQGGQ
jgi:hypothetical protein